MKIYVVQIGWNYEGSVIMGVHGNVEDSKCQADKLSLNKQGDYVEVQEWELGETKEEI